jgi:hypothetical protein
VGGTIGGGVVPPEPQPAIDRADANAINRVEILVFIGAGSQTLVGMLMQSYIGRV